MNISKTPGKDFTNGNNFLSKVDFSNVNDITYKVRAPTKTNSLLIAIAITLFLIFMVLIVYTGWLWYVREEGETPSSFYSWLL